MNRSIVYAGVALMALGTTLALLPYLRFGHEQIDLIVEAGLFTLPGGVLVLLWGALSPDPELSTVSGFLGNPDENVLRRQLAPHLPVGPARYLPSPRESVNCRLCNTAMSPRNLNCPRCGRRRECSRCHKPLYRLAGAVRCAPCVRDEVYCNCPVFRRPPATGPPIRRRG